MKSHLVIVRRVVFDALGHFDSDDGWAMASHVAMASLLALFPFLLFVAALAGLLASPDLATRTADLLLQAWPPEVAAPIAEEIHAVLGRPRQDLVTIGLVVTLWLASNGVEAMRVALNRAYRSREARHLVLRRAQSLVLVVVGAFGFLALSLLVVAVPLAWRFAVASAPWIEPMWEAATVVRYGFVTAVLSAVLFAAHRILPAQPPKFAEIWPGVAFTLVLWLATATGFGIYLANYSSYAAIYAGLAGVMSALVFLYLAAVVFILGGELNASIRRFVLTRMRAEALSAQVTGVTRGQA